LTELGFNHSFVQVQISKSGTFFASRYSSVAKHFQVSVNAVEFSQDAPKAIKIAEIPVKIPHVETHLPVAIPELFSFKNSIGLTIHGALFKPRNFQKGKKYPTLLYVYGGPHVQLVVNDYEKLTLRNAKFSLYSHLGFAVVILDGVGSNGRGLSFESHVKHKMGTVELRDQIEGLEHLIEEGVVDRDRIAVSGWSYGGYMSLMAIGQRPDFFKLALSGAPVTLWEGYDTAYTERYMGTPKINPKGYLSGSVLSYVNNFPEEEGRLLIIHGLKDENVHFAHTSKFIDALISAGKPYELYVYPSERHGVRSPHNQAHLEHKLL